MILIVTPKNVDSKGLIVAQFDRLCTLTLETMMLQIPLIQTMKSYKPG